MFFTQKTSLIHSNDRSDFQLPWNHRPNPSSKANHRIFLTISVNAGSEETWADEARPPSRERKPHLCLLATIPFAVWHHCLFLFKYFSWEGLKFASLQGAQIDSWWLILNTPHPGKSRISFINLKGQWKCSNNAFPRFSLFVWLYIFLHLLLENFMQYILITPFTLSKIGPDPSPHLRPLLNVEPSTVCNYCTFLAVTHHK